MRLIIVLISVLYLSKPLVYAQQVEGKILDQGKEAVAFANIGVKNTPMGTSSDEEGRFVLSLDPGSYALVISMVGYTPLEVKVQVNSENLDLGELTLAEDLFGLDEVVVTGTMTEKFVKASPVKVDVITGEFMKKSMSPVNLVEGLSMVNGLQEVVACGVCFTNSISINGLPGQYTAVLVDGSPIFGNLASVYGLNGISTSIIDRVEIIKGPNSTLYGSEAMAGVINIITVRPDKHPAFKGDVMMTSHLESFGNFSFAPKTKIGNGLIGINYAYINDFDDWNEDGFGDIVNLDRWSLFTKWDLNRKSGKNWTVFGKLYYEDRRNGVEDFLENRAYKQLRGSDSVYGESIYTYRAELLGNVEITDKVSVDYSASYHLQDSYYGTDYYRADQNILFSNIKWIEVVGNHELLGGITLRKQYYNDNTVATEVLNGTQLIDQPQDQFIPGVFLQDEWKVNEKIRMLGGFRVDRHKDHGLEYSPRLSLKYNPGTYTTLRFNTGTGFKVVNLFTEDHAFITGQREVLIEEHLMPERSISITGNLNHVFAWNESQGMFDLDLFYTRFSNKILPDYSDPSLIIYANSEGNAYTRGIGVSMNHQFLNGLGYNINVNWQDAFELTPQGREEMLYAPAWTVGTTFNYPLKQAGIEFAYTLRFTGPMELPAVYDVDEAGNPLDNPRPLKSEPFGFQNIQITKQLGEEYSLYLGVQNMFNYRQEGSPLAAFNDPNFNPGFSPYFDTSYAYSPIHGRELYIGVRLNLK